MLAVLHSRILHCFVVLLNLGIGHVLQFFLGNDWSGKLGTPRLKVEHGSTRATIATEDAASGDT